MKVALGGNRLGSGKKADVKLKAYERSNHNQSKVFRTTMSVGTLVPFYFNLLLPGTTIDINTDVDVKTHPAIGPLFGTMKCQGDFFTLPVRLYQARLHNNPLEVGLNMASVKLPLMTLYATPYDPTNNPDINTSQVNPSCLLAYAGIRGVGLHSESTIQTRDFHAVKILGYWDTYKNYYANKQEKIGAVIHSVRLPVNETIDTFTITTSSATTAVPLYPTTGEIFVTLFGATGEITFTGDAPNLDDVIVRTSDGKMSVRQLAKEGSILADVGIFTFTIDTVKHGNLIVYAYEYLDVSTSPVIEPQVTTFDLQNIDLMRKHILTHLNDNVPVNINSANLQPYSLLLDLVESSRTNYVNSQEGLALKTYQSDIFNNWLDTEFMDNINTITAIDTSSGSFTMDTLLLQKKIYIMLNRVAVSGGSYQDWIAAVYDHMGPWRAESPVYHGGFSRELGFQEIWANSQSQGDAGLQPLGTLAGKGDLFGDRKGGHVRITADEPMWVMGIFSVTPRLDYSQGNDWDVHLKTVDDFHKPGLDGIGFQDLITEKMAWWDTQWDDVTSAWIQHAAGKQPAWIDYRTAYNQTYGNFAIESNEMFMTLNRRYTWDGNTSPDASRIFDLTSYIDPAKFNNIFAQRSLDAQNLWVQIAMDVTTRRKMSAREIPNL